MSWNALVINIAVKSHWYSTGINQFSWGHALRCHSPKRPRDGSRDAHLDHEYFDLCRRVPLVFTRSCNDRHILHFPPTTWLNNGFTVFFNLPLQSFRQPHHSIFPKYCYLLEQGTLPGAFCSLPGNGNFSPLREIQKDWTKQPCKVARSAGYYGQITTGQPGWEHWPGHQRETTLSPHPEASLSSDDKLWTLPGVVLSVGLLGSHTCCK